MALEHGNVGSALEPLLDAVRGATGDFVLARLDALHVDLDRCVDHDSVIGGVPRQVRRIRAGNQRLGRHAAGVDTGAAEVIAFDDGHFAEFRAVVLADDADFCPCGRSFWQRYASIF